MCEPATSRASAFGHDITYTVQSIWPPLRNQRQGWRVHYLITVSCERAFLSNTASKLSGSINAFRLP
jgi:hypothetical protein